MLDLKLIRTQPDLVRARLAVRDPQAAAGVDAVLDIDLKHRAALTRLEEQRAKVNASSKDVGRLMKEGKKDEATAIQELVRGLKKQIEEDELQVRALEGELDAWLFKAPNMVHESVQPGGETDAREVRSWGERRSFDFTPKPHWDIAEQLGLVDFARGARMSGSGFVLYRAQGAQLERALIQLMIDLHVERHGYTEFSTPFFLNRQSVTASAHIVKFTPEMYHDAEDDLYALPTAEPALINIHRDEILDGEDLPLNYVAYSPCWRREAGSAGKDTRGLLRVHQFDKVEMVKFTTPESSYDELEIMVGNATDVLETLGLPYRVMQLAAGDLSFAAAKCYDIEAYAPGTDKWLEVSSCSNCEDFQSRRGNIRFRRGATGRPEFVHLLNGSGTALPRVVASLLETYQNADGTVTLPEALRPYMKGAERLEGTRAREASLQR